MSDSTEKQKFVSYTNKTPEFSLNNINTYARVVSIYDGDSIHCIIPIYGGFHKFSVRLNGIDTCEMKSKNQANKDLAVKARNRLVELITKKSFDPNIKTKKQIEMLLESDVFLVYIRCKEFDKYGRIIGDIFLTSDSPQSLSSVLLEESLAYPYQGETKLTEEQQVHFLTTNTLSPSC